MTSSYSYADYFSPQSGSLNSYQGQHPGYSGTSLSGGAAKFGQYGSPYGQLNSGYNLAQQQQLQQQILLQQQQANLILLNYLQLQRDQRDQLHQRAQLVAAQSAAAAQSAVVAAMATISAYTSKTANPTSEMALSHSGGFPVYASDSRRSSLDAININDYGHGSARISRYGSDESMLSTSNDIWSAAPSASAPTVPVDALVRLLPHAAASLPLNSSQSIERVPSEESVSHRSVPNSPPGSPIRIDEREMELFQPPRECKRSDQPLLWSQINFPASENFFTWHKQ